MSEWHPRVMRMLYVIGIAAMVLVAAAVGAVGVATTALPGCESCHFDTPAFAEATLSTAHRAGDVTCVACHVETDRVLSRTRSGFYQVFGMWLPILDVASTDVALVRDSRCLECHEGVMEVVLASRGLRIVHSSCSVGRLCVDCHSEVGHAEATSWPRVTSMNDCTRCHRSERVSLECETCHTGRMLAVRSSQPEFAVTHGPNWEQTHGMGEMASCSVCHAEDTCAGCHGAGVPHGSGFIQSHASLSTAEDAQCLSCHREEFCFSCHRIEMPHPTAFTRTHAETVERDGQQPCLRCHDVKDCDTCHVTHVHPGGSVGTIPSPSRGDD